MERLSLELRVLLSVETYASERRCTGGPIVRLGDKRTAVFGTTDTQVLSMPFSPRHTSRLDVCTDDVCKFSTYMSFSTSRGILHSTSHRQISRIRSHGRIAQQYAAGFSTR